MINRVILVGFVGKEPESRSESLTVFTMATNENFKNSQGEWQQRTEWHNIKCWKNNAVKARKLKKGDTVYVEGKVSTSKWTDKSGTTRYNFEIEASYITPIAKTAESQPESQPVSEAQSQTQPLPF